MIYLTECHSTNDYLQELVRKRDVREGEVVVTDFQLKGKGQRGNFWESDRGVNLLFSVIFKPSFLKVEEQFYITLITALSIIDSIREPYSKAQIKWPNDIYFNSKKIGGILSEATISDNTMEYVISGIGLNVNQRNFTVDTASSLLLETGRIYARDDLFNNILANLDKRYDRLSEGHSGEIIDEYHEHLMWKDETHLYRDKGGDFEGTICGINRRGQLIVEVQGTERVYNIKEISFLR